MEIAREIFDFKMQEIEASGYLAGEEMVVVKGSLVSENVNPSMPLSYLTMRRELFDSGIIAICANGWLEFTSDYKFDNPSAAANVICGGSRNGHYCWKDRSGKSLGDRGWSRAFGPNHEGSED